MAVDSQGKLVQGIAAQASIAIDNARLYNDLTQKREKLESQLGRLGLLDHILQTAYDDLRQTQHVVLQQERLRALGQMASGIAHDINNAISPASLYVEGMLERATTLGSRDREHLEIVRVGHLIQQVLALTRARWSDIPQERGIVINPQTNVAADLPLVTAAETEIRDSLTNLVFNAVDAMPEGRTFSLRAYVSHDFVGIEVRDTGTGMDEETRRRCLLPFYTTKELRGTGLGLAMVYGMFQRHAGEIEIDSELGKGTAIRLFIPTRTPDAVSVQVPSVPQRPAPGWRFLLVDDDPLLLNSLRDILAADGHHVTVASGGKDGIAALTAAEERDVSFSAIITDLGMPHVDGRKVASAAHRAAPKTPVILLTGWGQRLIDEDEIPLHVSRVSSKPPKLEVLRAALAQLTAAR